MTWIWISIIVVLVGASSMRKWSIRRSAKAPPGNQSRSGDAGQEWPTRSGQHRTEKRIDGMLTISEAQRRIELFLTGQMLEAYPVA
jgi:hypothetical protein